MKYLVIECHPAYAVLMDEASRFVRAANLHYTVGQTVTDPVLMQNETTKTALHRSVIVRITAAAACLLLLSAAGFRYYNRNLKTESVVVIASGFNIEMGLNSRGKVISLNSDTENGQALLREYSGKNKTSVEAANDLLQLQIDKGMIADGDTVRFYIASDNAASYSAYKTALEAEIPKMSLHIEVEEMTPAITAPAANTEAPAQTAAPAQPSRDPVPPAEAVQPHENAVPQIETPHAAPSVPSDSARNEGSAEPPHADPHAEPAEPPQPHETPQPPQPPQPPAGQNDRTDRIDDPPHPEPPSAPEAGAEPPHAEPPTPAEHHGESNPPHAEPPIEPPVAPPAVPSAVPPTADLGAAPPIGNGKAPLLCNESARVLE